MFVLLQNTRGQYSLLGLSENTSSTWQTTKEDCFDYWDYTTLSNWRNLYKASIGTQLKYLNDSDYVMLDMYKKKNTFSKAGMFTKVTPETNPEYFL